jgi:hypothetical protein
MWLVERYSPLPLMREYCDSPYHQANTHNARKSEHFEGEQAIHALFLFYAMRQKKERDILG